MVLTRRSTQGGTGSWWDSLDNNNLLLNGGGFYRSVRTTWHMVSYRNRVKVKDGALVIKPSFWGLCLSKLGLKRQVSAYPSCWPHGHHQPWQGHGRAYASRPCPSAVPSFLRCGEHAECWWRQWTCMRKGWTSRPASWHGRASGGWT